MSLLQLFHDPLDLAWGTQGFQIVTEKGTECEHPCGDWGHAGRAQGYQASLYASSLQSSPQLLLKGRSYFFVASLKSQGTSHIKSLQKKVNPHPHKPLSAPHPHKSNQCSSVCGRA